MEKKIAALNPRKNGGSIPTRILIDMRSVVSKPLAAIWKEQCVEKRDFPSKLKLGDITAVFKALEKNPKEELLQTHNCLVNNIQIIRKNNG